MNEKIKHRLPEDSGNYDTTWFERLNDFEKQETRRQVKYKRETLKIKEDGPWSKNRDLIYPHILPDVYKGKNFYEGINKSLDEYLESEKIALHTEIQNMRSSQACCWNFMFPLRQNLIEAAQALRSVLPGVKRITNIEFEYTGPEDTTAWLGEPPYGKRGQNRTSADADIWWEDNNNGKKITIIEWKYTEKEFGTCGGYQSDDNEQKDKCRLLNTRNFNPSEDCYLETGGSLRTQRKYWEQIKEAGIKLSSYSEANGCPFRGPFYQLMRLHLLGTYTAKVEKRDFKVVVICFKQNYQLLKIRHNDVISNGNIIDSWRELLSISEKAAIAYIDDICRDFTQAGLDKDWLAYLSARYGVKVN